MIKTLFYIASAATLVSASLAQANIEVDFVESAPKDRFVVKNLGECALKDLQVDIDLTKSAGRLIFDTTGTGAGVEVFQPFEVREGDIKLVSSAAVKDLVSSAAVKDGDSVLSISIGSLPVDKSVSFTIDVDDTLTSSELGNIRVSGSEIKDGSVTVSAKEQQAVSAVFGSDSKATVLLNACAST